MLANKRIENELIKAFVYNRCIQIYTDKKRKMSRYYSLFIVLFSSIGALGSIIDTWFPIVSSIIIAIVSIMKSIMPNLLQTESELSELDNLSTFYGSYFNALEKLWYNLENSIIDEKNAMDTFFSLKEQECAKSTILNKNVQSISKKLNQQLKAECQKYIQDVYTENDI